MVESPIQYTEGSFCADGIEIIEKNVKEAILNKDIEIFIFGNLYDNEKGIHDIHMNQGSQSPHDVNDRANNDGGIFFYNNETEKWTSLFIMFENQTLHTDEYGKAKKTLDKARKPC